MHTALPATSRSGHARPKLALLLLALLAPLLAGCMPGYVEQGDAVVATDQRLASFAGTEMLRQGGNAVDAAVAASFALSVVRPESCGIGGGGFMVIRLRRGEDEGPVTVALNYREMTPAAVGPAYYMPNEGNRSSRLGGSAVAVPGAVAGLLHALETYGTLERETVLAPAIRFAESGFEADQHFVDAARVTARLIEETPNGGQRFAFLYEELLRRGDVEVGDRITNPRQAEALRLIAERGAEAFYDGPIGAAVVEAVQRDGGDMTMTDLAGYEVETLEPLRGTFGEYEVLAMPPPSSGGIAILQIVGMIEEREAAWQGSGPGEARFTHVLTEAMKHAFADRARWLADPNFAPVPVARLLDDDYIASLAARIDMDGVLPLEAYGSHPPDVPAGGFALPPDDAGTSHISVIDHKGNAVACTETINLSFGSKLAVAEYGFLLNNEMDDFLTVPGEANAFGLTQSRRNLPEPGKRPLSSMSPTLVLRGGRPVLAVGASGGPRIISSTLQVLLSALVFEMKLGEAVAAPRLHHQWQPNLLRLEDGYADEETRAELTALGHELADYPNPAAVQVVLHRGRRIGASDPRKGGEPDDYDVMYLREPRRELGVFVILGGRY